MYRLFLLTFCVSVFAGSQKSFRKDYEYQKLAEGWMKLHRSPGTWFQARERCQSEGSILASPLDKHLQEAMLAVLGEKAHSIYTGISSTIANGEFFPEKVISETKITNGEYFSIEGVPLDDIPANWGWASGPGNHHCIAMDTSASLTDVDCNESRPYICFKKDTHDIPQVTRCGTVDKDYVYEDRTGHCYKFHKTGGTWFDAFRTCSAEGGYLAVVDNASETEVFKSILEKHPESERDAKEKKVVNIGLLTRNIGGTTGWMDIRGKPHNLGGWKAGQKIDDDKYEYCGGIDNSGLFILVNCRSTLSFICEMDLEQQLTLRNAIN